MHIKVYLEKLKNLTAENRLLKFAVFFLTLGFVWCCYELSSSKDKIRTVVVPPVINSKIEIYGSWTTDSYVKEYMRYVGALLWTYSPGTAREQFGELVPSWHPDIFEEAKKRLYIMADEIEKTKASAVFYINKIEHNAEKKLIEVTGQRRLTMQDKEIENTSKTYIVTYVVNNGRFWILGVEDKSQKAKTIGTGQPQPAAQKTNSQSSDPISNAKPQEAVSGKN